MGYHTIISISHDAFNQGDILWLGQLNQYVRSADRETARRLDHVSRGAVKVIATRHHSDPFYVSKSVDGFPTQLPFDEKLDEENAQWEAAETKARAWLGKGIKLRTIAQLRDLIVKLITKHKTAEASIKAADGAYLARRKLSDPQWRPSRVDYESLKNRLADIEVILGEAE
jgi:hypothetical protein